MKQFRSSKTLKAIQPIQKQEGQLRMRIKLLEEQVENLQKTHLNILIPTSDKQSKLIPNQDQLVIKLRSQILNLQQQNQGLKANIKRLEHEKDALRQTHASQMSKLLGRIAEVIAQKEETCLELKDVLSQLQLERQSREKVECSLIETKVQNKFMKEDLELQKRKTSQIEKAHSELQACVLAVNFHSQIYKSKVIRVTAIETHELNLLKMRIIDLENQVKALQQKKGQTPIHLGMKKNLGQEIVRLKKNIDLQLGLQINENVGQSFLHAYNQTRDKFEELLTGCRK